MIHNTLLKQIKIFMIIGIFFLIENKKMTIIFRDLDF